MEKTSRKIVSKTKLKLNKTPPKTKNSRILKSVEDLDEDSGQNLEHDEMDSRADNLGRTGDEKNEGKTDNTVVTKKYKDLAEIPGVLVVRGGFNSGFDMLARTTHEPIRISISGDNLPGRRDDRKHFGVRLGNKNTPLPGIPPLDETSNMESMGQMYDEEDFAPDSDDENEEK